MRSVGVRLRLNSRDYERDARRAAKATDEIGDAGRRTSRDLDGLSGAMDRAAKASQGLARSGGGGRFGPRMGLHGYLVAGVVGAITAAAPMLGAMIAGAVVGAAGVGGLVGGIIAAKDDERVRSAARDFMGTLKDEWAQAGQPFVAPTVEALGILEQAVVDLDLEKMLAPAAAHMDELAHGAAGFVTEFGQGFGEAMANAGPFLDELGRQLPEIGEALGDFFADLSESESVLEGFAFFLNFLEGSIQVLGDTLGFLSDQFQRNNDMIEAQPWYRLVQAWLIAENAGYKLARAEEEVAGGATNIRAAWGSLDPATRLLAESLGLTAAEAEALSGELDTLDDKLRAIIDRAFGLVNAQSDLEAGIDKLTEQIKEQREAHVLGAGGFEITTEAGRDNLAVLEEIVEAQAQITQETVAATGSTAEAAAAFDDFTFRMQLLADQLGIDISKVQAYNDAVAGIERLIEVDMRFRITAQTPITTANYWQAYGEQLARQSLAMSHGGIVRAATGRLDAGVVSSPTVLFGERSTGGEAYVPRRGNPSRSMAILGQAAGWYGADVVPRTWASGAGSSTDVNVRVSIGGSDSQVKRAVADLLRVDVQTGAGSSVQTRYGERGRLS